MTKTPDSVRRGLASNDVDATCAAIRAMVDRLLKGTLDDPMDAADAVTPLRDHPKSAVRRAVADACTFLPDPAGEATLALLRKDDDTYVRDAAAAASKTRA